MTADEIRGLTLEIVKDEDGGNWSPNINQQKFIVLREIAAQLAEFNEGLREGEFVLFPSTDARRNR